MPRSSDTKGQAKNTEWNIGAKQALYSKRGTWYHNLTDFPGALTDENGYVLFDSREEYETCEGLSIGKELNIHSGISTLPGYVRMNPEGLTTVPTPRAPTDLKRGNVLSNAQICDIFACSPQGGMRRSLKSNSLVIVSDHTKTVYEDKWIDNIFHYTGMGLEGDQSLSFSQNKTLAESQTNGVSIYLFEVFEDAKYVYQGQVTLSAEPYEAIQLDIKGNRRRVFIFPLKLGEGKSPVPVLGTTLAKRDDARRRLAQKLSTPELLKRTGSSGAKPGTRVSTAKIYERSAYVAELARRRAKGICQLCNTKAPFLNRDQEPYLETHHIEWLAWGGADETTNTVELCPNCHRKMHVLDLESDKLILRKKAQEPCE